LDVFERFILNISTSLKILTTFVMIWISWK